MKATLSRVGLNELLGSPLQERADFRFLLVRRKVPRGDFISIQPGLT
jgi:hypothetical protein